MKITFIETETSAGDPLKAQAIEDDGMVQMNVFIPPKGGSGFFVLFPADKRDEALAAAVKLADAAPHDGSEDITSQVDGALSAWLMPQPKFAVASG